MIALMSRTLCLFVCFLLTACASDTAFMKGSPEADYNHIKYLLDEGIYGKANKQLRQFGTDHPYSKYAVKAEVLRVYAAYKAEEFILAETLGENFISQHPTYPDLSYIKFLLAMSYYQQVEGSAKDQTYTKSAIHAFERLISEHAGSGYAKKGQGYLTQLYTKLAKQEMHVGHYYFEQDRYVAAANRFLYVVEHYQTIPVVEEAMYYLVMSYGKLNMKKHAQDIARLLRHNYPHSVWNLKLSENM